MEYNAFSAAPLVVPDELTGLPQWLLWRGEEVQTRQGSKITKIPINAQTLSKASTTDPRTWASYPYCVDALPSALEEWQADDPDGFRDGATGHSSPPVGTRPTDCRTLAARSASSH